MTGPPVDVGALLEAAEAAPPAEGADAVAEVLARRLGATEVSFLIADISGGSLVRLARSDGAVDVPTRPVGERIAIAGTPAGAALRTQQVEVAEDDGVWVYAPVTQRGETVGVLELLLPHRPDAEGLHWVTQAAHALAYVVVADRRHSDHYEWGQRSTPLSLEAEIQRRLLPPSYTCEGGQFTLAGWLIPANEAGGDTFDYVVGRDTLHLSVTDAMGHGVRAAQLATLTVGSLRNSRRRGAGVLEMAAHASRALATYATDDQFVTGLLLRVRLSTGEVEYVNAGHVAPLVVRDGRVHRLEMAVDAVLGVLPDLPYTLQTTALEPGDRVVLLTDGMYERNAAGAEVEELLATLGHLHPREAVQALTGAVLQATGGDVLDDATALVLDWYGGPSRDRGSSAGADDGLASA